MGLMGFSKLINITIFIWYETILATKIPILKVISNE